MLFRSFESHMLPVFAPQQHLQVQHQEEDPSSILADVDEVLASAATFDELFNSILESVEPCDIQQQQQQPSIDQQQSGQHVLAAGSQQTMQVIPVNEATTVQQLFASLDPECGMELAAGCGINGSQGIASRPTSAARSVSPVMVASHGDHDYVTTRFTQASTNKNGSITSTDLNNNRLDLLLAGCGVPAMQKLQFPLSPLSAHSSDFGYESAASPASITSSSSSNPNSSPLKTPTENFSPFGSDEDDFLMNDLSLGSLMQPSVLDPMMFDPTLLELFPEMF